MRASTATLALSLVGASCASLYGETQYNHSCVLDPAIRSCSPKAKPATVDTCCAETYGGLLLSTQFWTIYTGLEDQGQVLPADTWTLHGLWPDFCSGSYTQYCDLSRQYDPDPSPNTTTGEPDGTPVPPYTGPRINPFAESGKLDLLEFMDKYWINQGRENYELWVHEYSKHATCFSTFDVPCYGPDYIPQEDVIDYFETAIRYYLRLPTWDWLDAHDIRPSNSTTYSLSAIEDALEAEYGTTPYVGCSGPSYNETAEGAGSSDDGRTQLSEVWYFFHVRGRPQSGDWLPISQTGSSSCAQASGAIHYFEPAPGSVEE
ncbi:hypothetical protein LTR37_016848 [Vermiconidia calcicola]|uniref:Uncharacterized protein n=1 Tax=Vermiconidia calcicola TaxID=1690605 RepID=A0ACC3MLK8_9PEZI|nr:hypothetical protein LTR37_016848 [Vermiconidia calcicola]